MKGQIEPFISAELFCCIQVDDGCNFSSEFSLVTGGKWHAFISKSFQQGIPTFSKILKFTFFKQLNFIHPERYYHGLR